jgi:septin family protein
MATMDRHNPQQSVFPRSHVGFDSITSQIERKLLKRGFQFNVICVGKSIQLELEAGIRIISNAVLLQDKLVSESRL